jgi:hypothetical protein
MKSMDQRNTKTNCSHAAHGLSLSGTVIDRTRRMVPHDHPTTEIVTYTIQDGYNRKFYVNDYASDGYHGLNSSVCFIVYIKAYNHKNGAFTRRAFLINQHTSCTIGCENIIVL